MHHNRFLEELTVGVDLVERAAMQRHALELVGPRRGGEARGRQRGGHDPRGEELVLQELVHGRPPRRIRLQLQHYHRRCWLAQR